MMSKNQSGFTMLEVLVVLSIFGALIMMGLFFDFTFYRGTAFSTDVDAFASILQRARAKAINNINESNHGVYIDADNYELFEGDSYATAIDTQSISRSSEISFSHTEFVFSQLSGDSNFEGDIIITGFGKTAVISMNNEGLINR
jgi:prepilin-type N-terminal cleavage/methylation domain-containing protein